MSFHSYTRVIFFVSIQLHKREADSLRRKCFHQRSSLFDVRISGGMSIPLVRTTLPRVGLFVVQLKIVISRAVTGSVGHHDDVTNGIVSKRPVQTTCAPPSTSQRHGFTTKVFRSSHARSKTNCRTACTEIPPKIIEI